MDQHSEKLPKPFLPVLTNKTCPVPRNAHFRFPGRHWQAEALNTKFSKNKIMTPYIFSASPLDEDLESLVVLERQMNRDFALLLHRQTGELLSFLTVLEVKISMSEGVARINLENFAEKIKTLIEKSQKEVELLVRKKLFQVK